MANQSSFRTPLSDVGFHDLLPSALSFKDELNGVAEGAVATGVGRDVVRFRFHFGAGVLHGDGQPAARMAGRSMMSSPMKAASSEL